MFGWGYVKDTCIALFNKEQEEKLYKNYIANTLQNISENTSKIVHIVSRGQMESKYMSKTFDDILNPKPEKVYKKGETTNRIRQKLR